MKQTNGTIVSNRANYSPVAVNRRAPIAQVNQYIDSASEEDAATNATSADNFEQDNRRLWHEMRTQGQPPKQTRLNTTLAKARPGAELDYTFDNNNHSSDEQHSLQQEEHRLPAKQVQEEEEGEINSALEAVYLCSCCGITKELGPAMRYLPTFRSLFYLFNFLSFGFAFALLGFGLWFRIDPKVYELHKYIETQNFTIAGWIMLFGGFLTCVMTLAGCQAANRKSASSLLFYCTIMTLVTIAFISSLVLLTVHGLGQTLERFLSKEIYDQIRRRVMNTEMIGDEDPTQFLDFVQVKLRCCGAVDFRDYQRLGMVLPTTCYTIPSNYIMAPGCAEAIRRMFDLRAGLSAGFTAASVLVQLLAIIFASMMVCSIHNYRTNTRPDLVSSVASLSVDPIRTPAPVQFEKQSARARDYEQRSRPSSRASIASIRV